MLITAPEIVTWYPIFAKPSTCCVMAYCMWVKAGIVIKLPNGTLGYYSIRNEHMVATGRPYMSTFFVADSGQEIDWTYKGKGIHACQENKRDCLTVTSCCETSYARHI